jgi:hypothetical protein
MSLRFVFTGNDLIPVHMRSSPAHDTPSRGHHGQTMVCPANSGNHSAVHHSDVSRSLSLALMHEQFLKGASDVR